MGVSLRKSLTVKWVDPDKVKPYDRNPRRNDLAVDGVAESLKEFGWRQPLVIDGDGVLIAGHTRLRAAKSLGLDKVPVHVADDLTPDQVRALRIADNRTGEAAEWDEELLSLELGELRLADFDLEVTGFTSEDLEQLGKLGLGEKEEPPAIEETASRTISITVPPKMPQEIAKACAKASMSRNEWLVAAIREALKGKS